MKKNNSESNIKIYQKLLSNPAFFLVALSVFLIPTAVWSFTYAQQSAKLFIFQIICGLILIAIVAHNFSIGLKKFKTPINGLILAFLIYNIISAVIISDYKTLGYKNLIILAFTLFFALSIRIIITNEKQTTFLIKIWVFTGSVISIMGIIQSLITKNQAFATFRHPNHLAVFLIMTLPLAIFLYRRSGSKTFKLIYAFSIFFLLLCLIFTRSRSGLAAFFISSFIIGVIYWKNFLNHKKIQSSKKIIIIVSVFLLILLSVIFMLVKSLDEKELQRISSHESITIRALIWKGTFNMIKERALLGTGIGNYSVYFQLHKPDKLNQMDPQNSLVYMHAESIYLETLAENGILGLILFLGIIITAIRNFNKIIKQDENRKISQQYLFLLWGFISLLILSGVCCNLQYISSMFFFWLYIGLANLYKPDGYGKNEDNPKKIKKKKTINFFLILINSILILILITAYSYRQFYSDYNLQKAMQRYEDKDKNVPITYFEKSLSFNLNNYQSLYFSSRLLYEKGNWNLTIERLEKLTVIHPYFSRMNYILAAAYKNIGNREKACENLKIMHQLNPYFPDIDEYLMELGCR